MTNIIPNGALIDARPQAERDRDYKAEELVASAAVPFNNPKPTKLGATLYSQEYTSSCVLHGFYTMLEYEGIVAPAPNGMSQLRAYRKRPNYPQPGTAAVAGFEAIRGGQSRNIEAPVTENMSEAQANAMPLVVGAKLLKDFNYFEFTNRELVPAAVAGGKAVAVFIYATEAEWSREYVEIQNPNLNIMDAYVRHCVCIMPRGDFTENGVKYLAVQDSAAFGGRHLRYMPLEFFRKRAYYAAQVFPKDGIPLPEPPNNLGKPTTPCEFGQKNDAVRALQAFLVSEKKLGAQYVTGNYGALTAKAVLWWQLEHWQRYAAGVPQLLEWGGKFWGNQSIAIIS